MKGIYILIISLDSDKEIDVGALGKIQFREGKYCYVGSAYGPGGIESRVKRHLSGKKRKRWHIDYLLEHAEVEEVLIKEGGDEKKTALILSDRYEYVSDFGSSDSPARSHLFINPERSYLLHLGFRHYP